MRILLVSPYFYPHIGGSQQYALELYRNLIELDKSYQVDVICYNTNKAPSYEVYHNLRIYRIPCFDILDGQFAIPNYWELLKLIIRLTGKNKYKIVNSHTRFFENSWWTPVVSKLIGAKSILTDHASTSPIHHIKLITLVSRIIEKIVTKIILHLYDFVTVTNKATMKYIQSFGYPNPVLIYVGVDTKMFNPGKRLRIRVIPNISKIFGSKDIILTFVGRMIPTKGPQLVYEVAQKLVKKNNNLNFIFAGAGLMLSKLSTEKRKNIYFLNSLKSEEVANLLANTDILINPSYHFEGFPNVLLEAGAAGCTVIASDVGGSKELIEDQKTGIIISSDTDSIENAIKDLIKNPQKRRQLSRSLRKKIENNFEWKKIAREYDNFIKSVTS